MSSLLRFLIVIVICFGDTVLTSNLPSLQVAVSKTPVAKGLKVKASRPPRNRERYDNSVNDYLSERICGFNELCKEEFSSKFKCRCPYWMFCSSPGRYYNAYCVMSGAGYLWTQPQGFFNSQPIKPNTRYKKKYHKTMKTVEMKSLPHSLTN